MFGFLSPAKRPRSVPLAVPPLTERGGVAPPLDPVEEAIAAALAAQEREEEVARAAPESRSALSYAAITDAVARRFAEIERELDRELDERERQAERRRADQREAEARIAETLERNPNVARAPKRVSMLGIVERVRRHAEALRAEHERARYVPHITESYHDPHYNDRPSDGEQVYQRLLECFAAFPKPPTHFQHKLFTAAMSACAPMIFGDAFFSDPARYMELIKGTFTDGIAGALTGRKTGKSTGVAYIVICLMFCIKRFQCVVTSKTQIQAQIILDTVKGLIQTHPMWKAWGFTIEETRANALVIRGPDGSLRKLEARCGSGEVRRPFHPRPPLQLQATVWTVVRIPCACARDQPKKRKHTVRFPALLAAARRVSGCATTMIFPAV